MKHEALKSNAERSQYGSNTRLRILFKSWMYYVHNLIKHNISFKQKARRIERGVVLKRSRYSLNVILPQPFLSYQKKEECLHSASLHISLTRFRSTLFLWNSHLLTGIMTSTYRRRSYTTGFFSPHIVVFRPSDYDACNYLVDMFWRLSTVRVTLILYVEVTITRISPHITRPWMWFRLRKDWPLMHYANLAFVQKKIVYSTRCHKTVGSFLVIKV